MGKINTDNYPNRPVTDYQDDDMFILQDNGGETYTTNVGDIKNLADSRIKLEGVQVNGTDLPISGKKVNVDISGKTDLSVIAYTFNPEMGYFKGAYVTYNGKLYEFIQEHTGAWNPSHVREIRASGQYVRTGNGGYNNGDRATCEGYMTKASGNYSHAEGRETQAVGDCTHAEGRETIANGIYQHVEGKYNIADNESKYIHIIGNGIDDNNRSNAMTLDWDGNLEVSGEVEDGNGKKISDKADKVTNATSGHLAGLDSNGNLTDSGVSPTEDVTVEGNPVTFDSPFEQDAKSVVVSVKPIQDLHGYDHPWVGGAGKNKLPLTLANLKTWNTEGTWSGNTYTAGGVSFTCYTSDGDAVVRIHAEGTSGSTPGWLSLFKNGTLDIGHATILSGCPAGGGNLSYVLAGYLGNPNRWYEDNGNGADIPQDIDLEQVYIEIKTGYAIPSGGIDFYPMIRLATESDATFAPYSNICPISGIDEVEIGVHGKNYYDQSKAQINRGVGQDGTLIVLSGDNGYASDYMNVNPLTTYKYIAIASGGASSVGIAFYDSDKNVLSWSSINNVNANNYNITSPANAAFARCTMYINDGHYGYFGLESIYTGLEPYVGHTTTIPLPSTLYGGTVDVTKGNDTPTYGMVDLGSLDYSATAIDNQYFAIISSRYKEPTSLSVKPNWICESYDIGLPTYTDSLPLSNYTIGCFADFSQNNIVFVRDPRCSSAAEMKQALNGVHLVYELATPTTISLTPTDVELLEGMNVVSTNAEKVAVTYGRSLWQDIDELKTDTEGKLNKSDVADVEGDTASRPYSVNEFMLRSDGFYQVTQPIAQNASITASNTTKTTIGAVLTALLNA